MFMSGKEREREGKERWDLGAVGSPIALARDHHHVRLPPNLIETRNLEEIPFKFQVKPTASLLHPLFTSSFRENNPQIK
jgi:hypothetical protein